MKVILNANSEDIKNNLAAIIGIFKFDFNVSLKQIHSCHHLVAFSHILSVDLPLGVFV